MSLGVLTALFVFAGIALLLPARYTIHAQRTLPASQAVVFSHIQDITQWNLWAFDSLMLHADPQDITRYRWNDAQGGGTIQVVETEASTRIVAEILVSEGSFRSKSTFLLQPKGDSTLVTWTDEQHLGFNFLARYVAFFGDFEEKAAEGYQHGLVRLGTLTESAKTEQRNEAALLATTDSAVAVWQDLSFLVTHLGDLRGKTFAEIGAKQGYFAFGAGTQADKVIVLAFSKEFADLLKARSASTSTRTEVRRTGAISPALYEAEADVVLLTHIWHELNDVPTYLRRIRRGIKPRGALHLLLFFERVPEGYPALPVRLTPDEAQKILEEVGFADVKKQPTAWQGQWLFTARQPA